MSDTEDDAMVLSDCESDVSTEAPGWEPIDWETENFQLSVLEHHLGGAFRQVHGYTPIGLGRLTDKLWYRFVIPFLFQNTPFTPEVYEWHVQSDFGFDYFQQLLGY